MTAEFRRRVLFSSAPEAPGGAAAAVGEGEGETGTREELTDQLLRLRAEFDNYRRRVSREREEDRARLVAGLVTDLLPVLDALEGAVSAGAGDAAVARYQQGVKQILAQFRSVLEDEGIAEVPGAGTPFDPELHEAVETVDAPDASPGTILEVLQKGYRLGGRLLRAARVRVASRPPGSGQMDEEDER